MEDFSYAYSEVIEVLRYIPEEDYNKVSIKLIKFLEENANENSDFTYNMALPFNKQKISREAKTILAIICKLYWNK